MYGITKHNFYFDLYVVMDGSFDICSKYLEINT